MYIQVVEILKSTELTYKHQQHCPAHTLAARLRNQRPRQRHTGSLERIRSRKLTQDRRQKQKPRTRRQAKSQLQRQRARVKQQERKDTRRMKPRRSCMSNPSCIFLTAGIWWYVFPGVFYCLEVCKDDWKESSGVQKGWPFTPSSNSLPRTAGQTNEKK